MTRTTVGYGLFGASFGTLFAVVAYIIDLIFSKGQMQSYWAVLHENPVQVVVACAPLILGLVFALAGVKQDRLQLQHEKIREADKNIHFLANHDALTTLPNRTSFHDLLAKRLNSTLDQSQMATLNFIDLDFFKDINDRHGHDFGDEVLKVVSARLKDTLRDGDLVARFGGDEFIIAQFGFSKSEQTLAATSRIANAFKTPFVINGHDFSVTASIGTAVSPEHGVTADALIRSADTAVYVVKARGRNSQSFFELKFDQERNQRLHLETLVRNAVTEKSFDLHFQPLFKFGTNYPTGFETLLRMKDESGNPVSPAKFIPVAEEIGLIDEIGTWVLDHACMTASTWPNGMQVSVNLSVAQFKRHSIVGCVKSALSKSKIAPSRLVLEITESLLMTETDSILEQLRELKALGVAIAMDDFGTGYSSLGYMLKFPFDRIKIDRSFINELATGNENANTLVNTIINLGHTLKMQVTAEGVETQIQADSLHAMKCDDAQGYHYARPMQATDVAAFLLKQFVSKAKPPVAKPSKKQKSAKRG
jgi:diguanylate cyclase (GGDEF)-like protein